MKKILILTIALLFIAGLAMAELTVTGEVTYVSDYYLPGNTNGANGTSQGEVKLMGAGSNDFASLNIDLKAVYSSTMDPAVDKAYFKLDVLGALGVEGVPVKLSTIFAYAEIKGSEVWGVTRFGLEKKHDDAGGKAGQFAFEAVIMDMVTVTIAQQTNLTGTVNAYLDYTIAPLLLSAKASIEFVDVAVNVDLQQAEGAANMTTVLSAGAAAELAGLLGLDLISSLKIGVGIGSDDITAAAGANINWGAGINLGLAPMDMVTIRFGLGTYNQIPNGVSAAAFQNLAVDLEVWYDFIGLGANTVLAFGNSAGTTVDNVLGITEIVILAKLSDVKMHLGAVIGAPDTGTDGDFVGETKYNKADPAKGTLGITFKASLKI